MKKIIFTLLLGNLLIGNRIVKSEEIELERIVVTPLRYTQEISKVPFSVTVITKSDIEKTNAQTMVDLLRPFSGVTVRDYFGNGVKASADLRGFGEFAGSNTLVLVDGRRVNEVDLSGVSWTQIPLETVERIEIIRGMGSVLYGDNAVGGVINIVTKKGEGKPFFEIETNVGSYETEKYRLEFGGRKEILSYFLQFNRHSTNGYRKNSDYRGEDFFGKVIYDFTDCISLNLSGGYHNADFGLPGALRESQLRIFSRRDTIFPEDNVGEEDGYLNLELKSKINEALEFDNQLSFRRREVDNYLLSSQALDHREIDTLSFRPSFILETTLLGRKNKFMGGIDFYWIDSLVDAYSGFGSIYYEGEKMRETAIDKDSIGYYFQNEIEFKENLNFLWGYRLEKTKYSFSSIPQPGIWSADPWISSIRVEESLKLDEESFNLGLNYLWKDDSKIFINFGKSFRFPATDEYYSIWATPPVNAELLPQTAYNYEIGMENKFNPSFKIGLNLFDMRLRNELYYDPITFTNRNYDKTEHRGMEIFAKWRTWECLTIEGNYNFTEAIFKEGNYSGNQIPLVPRHKFSLIGGLDLFKRWQLNTVLNYCGERFFINDQMHDYPPLDDFLTVDVRLKYRFKEGGDIYFGINNLFNEKYSEYGAISILYNEPGFYPAPERNFIMGLSYKF